MAPRARRSGVAVLGLGLILLAGCGQLPNPNDIARIPGPNRPEAAQRLLSSAAEYLDERVKAGELSDAQRVDLIRQNAEGLVQTIDPNDVQDEDLWIYGDLLRTTGRWSDAADVLGKAAKVAASWDRRVNDTLRWSSALAHEDKVPEAIAVARSVFNAPPDQSAPILFAVLYEIVPAAQGKGHDRELADLLEAAVGTQARTKVDPKTDVGKAFIAAARFHRERAERKIEALRAGGGGMRA